MTSVKFCSESADTDMNAESEKLIKITVLNMLGVGDENDRGRMSTTLNYT